MFIVIIVYLNKNMENLLWVPPSYDIYRDSLPRVSKVILYYILTQVTHTGPEYICMHPFIFRKFIEIFRLH